MSFIVLRRGNVEDLSVLKQLIIETICEHCKDDYTQKQLDAWVSAVQNDFRWLDVFEKQVVFVAESKDVIVGFCSLEDGDYLDMLYVAKDFQRKGTASLLLEAAEEQAKKKKQTKLEVDASLTAKAFFEKQGFVLVKELLVPIEGERLISLRMVKSFSQE